jgi:LysR family nitrogen assimilation transcriptional regulator
VQAGRLQAAQIVNPALTRHIALAVSRHGPLTLAGRTVMEMIQDIFKASRKIDF